jgi:ABC-type polysaccharide/polyol phosphate transport system ATPase subunit
MNADSPTTSEIAPRTVVHVDGLWKRFRANEYQPSLRHEAGQFFRRLVRRSEVVEEATPFWALRDVSFKVAAGETVGIIGRNGAGKSTLFRVMCGVSEPTLGQVTVDGRFAALIALGAGFIPELSGMDNIHMAASIQGLSRAETKSLMPNILAFAELGDAIHMPVKRYSSGMKARLGFSVAVHTLPDIIFLDEVLAVGDAAFQRKCRARIMQFQEEKRTMLFVSHASLDVRQLCERAIWLQKGEIRMDGPANEVVDAFEAEWNLPNSRARAIATEAEDPAATP